MTLYREAPECSHRVTVNGVCSDCNGRKVWVVPAEPTDRICDVHRTFVPADDIMACSAGVLNDETNLCVMVDVVRVDSDG